MEKSFRGGNREGVGAEAAIPPPVLTARCQREIQPPRRYVGLQQGAPVIEGHCGCGAGIEVGKNAVDIWPRQLLHALEVPPLARNPTKRLSR